MCCASPRSELVSWLVAAVMLTVAAPTRAQCPRVRPTDATGGLLHYADPTNVVFYDASDHVRIWYATAGSDAPAASAMGTSAPLNVELVGDVVEDARTQFASMGFRAPLGDGDYAPCASNGGDGRLDVYLIAFPGGADGSAGTDQCTADRFVTCSGFILLENDFAAGSYRSFEEAVRVVAPHELFHLVQQAYAADLDAWWSEGTAQWAADQLDPTLGDLERFLPTFFSRPEQPLDLSGGGATNAWLYATSIWAVFLHERYGDTAIVDVYAALGATGGPALDSISPALGIPLDEAFVTFASFNAATGDRAADGAGYAHAASYPMVPTSPLPAGDGTLAEGELAGLSAHYFVSHEARHLSLDADEEAVAAVALPLVDGHADLAQSTSLPADLSGAAVIVVAGRRTAKVDAAFALNGAPLPDVPDHPTEPNEPEVTAPPSSSCAMAPAAPRNSFLLLAIAGAAFARRRISNEEQP